MSVSFSFRDRDETMTGDVEADDRRRGPVLNGDDPCDTSEGAFKLRILFGA